MKKYATSRDSQTRLIAFTDCTAHLFLALRCPFLSDCGFASEPALTHRPALAALYTAGQDESRHLPTPASYTAFGEQHGPGDTERAFISSCHHAGNIVHESLAYVIDLQAGCQPFLSSRLPKLRPAWRFAARKALPGANAHAAVLVSS